IVVLSHIMLATCAKESEEQTTDEDDDYYEVMIGKSTPEKERLAAVHEWTTFKPDAEKLLSITKSNLNTLGVKINKNQDDQQLLELYTKSEKQYIDLKRKLDTENKNLLRDPE